jgi:tyrosinase
LVPPLVSHITRKELEPVLTSLSNVDRLLAIYQARYPDTWVEDSKQERGTFAIAAGSVLGEASPLPPFHMNAKGDMWTSTTVRDWTAFGYTYPELVGKPDNATLTSTINQLYKPQTPGLQTGNATLHTGNATVQTLESHNATQAAVPAIDWSCEVNMPSNIQISYSVRAFLGEPSKNPADWPLDDNYIGQLASMSSPRSNSTLIVTGNIGLSEALKRKHEAGELKSLEKETVQAYLDENFSWRIQALDMSEIPRSNPPPGLNVTVYNKAIVIPNSNTEVPTSQGSVQYNTEIQGNPPVYNGPGPDGTNSTVPSNQMTGQYDPSSGQFVWKNATLVSKIGNAGIPEPMPENMLLKPISLLFGQKGAMATSSVATASVAASSVASSSAVQSSVIPSSSVASSSAASSTLMSIPTQAAVEKPSAPEVSPPPTTPAGPQTALVTSVIVEYVTV